MRPRVPQDKDQRREISDLELMQPAPARPDPSAQGGEVPGPAGGRIVREEIKCDHGVDLPRCDELSFALSRWLSEGIGTSFPQSHPHSPLARLSRELADASFAQLS